jgi:Reverse transcriptase (RNA-dependent DNA polymerase)
MPDLRRLTALAIARAMLAGSPSAAGLAARIGACLDARADWHRELALRCAAWPGERWQRLTPRALATWVERDVGYQAAWHADVAPHARRYFLRQNTRLMPPPLGLEDCVRPHWPTTAALAASLRISDAGLWRLRCRPSANAGARSSSSTTAACCAPSAAAAGACSKCRQRRLLDALIAHIPPHEAAALTTTATPEPVVQRLREGGRMTWQQAQRLRDPHLPQGAPTSPALANLCAFGLDLRLDSLAHALGARYTRYADDIVLSGGTHLRDVRQRIESWVGRIAREEGFVLNHRKTRCLTAGRRQAVCNVVVNRAPNLARDQFDRLKAILHQCAVHGPSTRNREGIAHWREHLQGRVAWAAQLNAAKAVRLRRLLDAIDWSR